MRLSELCAKASVGPETVRYYERRGLLLEGRHFRRPAGGFRDYDEMALERLGLIARAKQAGITLAELTRWADEWERGTLPAPARRAFFLDKLVEVDARLLSLQSVRDHLADKVREIDHPREDGERVGRDRVTTD